MNLNVALPGFDHIHQDVIPYTQSLDTRRIMEMLVDDLNGLLNMAVDKLNGRDVDARSISNTLEHLVLDAAGIISASGMHDMKDCVSKMLPAIFDELRGYNDWINYRFIYKSHTVRGNGHWLLRMSSIKCHNFNNHDLDTLCDLAAETIEAYVSEDDHRNKRSSRRR